MTAKVLNFPSKPRPIPIPVPIEAEDDPHTLVLSSLKKLISHGLKWCGSGWVEKVLLAELSFVKARRMFETKEG